MYCIASKTRLLARYPADGPAILQAVGQLGTVVDVADLQPLEIQQRIALLPAGPVCLIGGVDLIVPFRLQNPTFGMTRDADQFIATDAPYVARPGMAYDHLAPPRALTRIPEPVAGHGPSFLDLLQRQAAVPATPTPPGSFELAASEFTGAQAQVRVAMDPTAVAGLPSPPQDAQTAGLLARISGRGRLHVALHGMPSPPGWGSLWGSTVDGKPQPEALLAGQLAQCQLQGMLATFSTCYAGMIDRGDNLPAVGPGRDTSNQVALACLAAGAKVVFASTRANWMDTAPPFDSLGPALTAQVWTELAAGHGAAEALRRAKWAYICAALTNSRESLPYVKKTVLQAHCYGHADARL